MGVYTGFIQGSYRIYNIHIRLRKKNQMEKLNGSYSSRANL